MNQLIILRTGKNPFFFGSIILFFIFICLPTSAKSQTSSNSQLIPFNHSLFTADSILELSISGRLKDLFNDRQDQGEFHKVTISYKTPVNEEITFNLEAKTRGHFRRLSENCSTPPILLHFNDKQVLHETIFKGQTWLKLVMPCVNDELVIREYLVYKMYNLLTPESFLVRLVKVNFIDSTKKARKETHLCFLIEDAVHLAKRNGTVVTKQKMVMPEAVDYTTFTTMTVFQYMIGNTDWSLPYLHNIKLLKNDSIGTIFPIAYDFDHAGIVRAPYAFPAEELGISTTQDRLYRGACIINRLQFSAVLNHFKEAKNDIYSLYSNCHLIDRSYVRTTLKFLDDFYKIIEDKKYIDHEFTSSCQYSQKMEIKGF